MKLFKKDPRKEEVITYEHPSGKILEVKLDLKKGIAYVFFSDGNFIKAVNGPEGYAKCKPFENKIVDVTVKSVYVEDYGDMGMNCFWDHTEKYIESVVEKS